MNLLFLVPHPLPLPFDFGIKLLSTNSIDEPCSQNAHAYTHAKKILKHFWFIRWHLCVDIKMRRNWLKPQRCIVHLLFFFKTQSIHKEPYHIKIKSNRIQKPVEWHLPECIFPHKKEFLFNWTLNYYCFHNSNTYKNALYFFNQMKKNVQFYFIFSSSVSHSLKVSCGFGQL